MTSRRLSALAAALLLCLSSVASAGIPTDQLRASVEHVLATLQDPALKPESMAAERRAAIRDAGVQHGMVLVNCLHTTCSVVITDSDIEDFVGLMARLIEDEGAYRHNDLRWSDCERGNAAAHLRASLLGHGVAIGIADGTLALDDEQAILLAEWDGPRSRTINIHILGA